MMYISLQDFFLSKSKEIILFFFHSLLYFLCREAVEEDCHSLFLPPCAGYVYFIFFFFANSNYVNVFNKMDIVFVLQSYINTKINKLMNLFSFCE